MKKYKYKFSVVIPIYNVEEYLEETIESVIAQSIGFEKNIQMILVNDGSPDNSEEICRKYEKMYPQNVKYIKQENAGVSAARNTGISYIEGKYVNFLDSDDKWDKHAFKKIYDFFEAHYDETDVVASRIRQFDANNSFHVLDYKFSPGTRIADLSSENEYTSIQLHVTSAVIKAQAIGENRFDSGIKFGEDSLFVNTLILDKCTLGLSADTMYYYRKRRDQSSAVQTQRLRKDYYFGSPQRYYYPLVELSKQKYGKVIPYIQNVLAYDMGWRLGGEIPEGLLNEREREDYYDMLHELYSYVDDSAILCNMVHKSIMRKMTAISIKNNSQSFLKDMTYSHEKSALYYGDIRMLTINQSRNACFINIAEIKNNCFHIEGLVAKWLLDSTKHKTQFVLRFGETEVKPELSPYAFKKENTLFGPKELFYLFTFDFPLDDLNDKTQNKFLTADIYFDDMRCRVGLNYGKFVPNYNSFVFAYKNFAPYYIKCYATGIRVAKPRSLRLTTLSNEMKCLVWLFLRRHFYAFFIRILYALMTGIVKGKKKIWIISDRSDKANDNGEAFFKYVCANTPEGVKPIFAINKNSDDVPRLKKIGRVIHFENKLYPIYFLSADKIISSSGGEYVINPFTPIDRRYLTDLMKFDYVFLQHGIIMNDLSGWLQKFNKNISLFVTSSKDEYESIACERYLYSPKEVKLTGLARFDDLEDNAEKLIVFLPTWRRSIKGSYDIETKSIYFDGFKETEYFKFYNGLINNEKLCAAMRENKYKGIFCLHPIHEKQSVDFESNDVIKVNSGFVDYKDIFSRGSLLVTDYSSASFDFSYLRKPVIYSQFDKEDFFEGQIFDEGYFSYEENGLGSVCYDLESTVDEIISFMENGCKLDGFYRKRIDDFFAYNDRNNCQRICDEILKLD